MPLTPRVAAGLVWLTACGVTLAQAPQPTAQAPASGQVAPPAGQRGGRGGRGGAPNEGRGQGGPALTIERDLEYSRAGGVSLTLDLYYIDPIGLDLGGTQYRLYPTPSRGADTLASYRVYFPPDYQASTTRRYPVIYFLHGRSVDSKRPITSGYVTRADAAIRSGVMPPAIVVLAQGLTTGWYVDAQDGQHPMESVIVKDLVAHVDATYRTMATREARAIEGHSMGGFGALHIGFKYPDLFAAVTGNSPALVENVTDGVGDQAFWDAQAPATLAKANIDKVRKQAIRIIVGDQDGLFPVGKKLDDALTELEIAHEFLPVVGSPHNHDQLLQYETFDTMAFYGKVFGKTTGK